MLFPRRGVLGMLLLVALVAAGGGDAATSGTGLVTVTRSGLFSEQLGVANYGLALRNRATTADAFGVSVIVRAFDSRGRRLATDKNTITMIPAATTFVLAGDLTWNLAVRATRISTVVAIERTAPRGRALPTFTHVRFKVAHTKLLSFGRITGSLRNPYAKGVPAGASIYALFLGKTGRIIGTLQSKTRVTLVPHASIVYTLDVPVSTPLGTSVQLSVDPCSDLASDKCPVTSTAPSPPIVMTAAALSRYGRTSLQRIYWAGPEAGVRYEYRETANGYSYLRYLPAGAAAGSDIPYRTVATYPFPDAFSSLQTLIAGRAGWARISVGPHVMAVYDRKRPTNVHVAFAGQAYQIEVYDPVPGAAIALVRSGRIRPVD